MFAKPSNGPNLYEENNARKDHCRDHFRDYHKEDIGAAKGCTGRVNEE